MYEYRKHIVRIFIFFVAFILLAKLFVIQIWSDDYETAAENNIVQRVTEYPYRGLIYDRHGELLVYNAPVFDVTAVPKEIDLPDTAAFRALLGITKEELRAGLRKAKRYSYIQPSTLIKQIPNETFAQIQGHWFPYKGFYPKARAIRGYKTDGLAHVLGYIGEIDKKKLGQDSTNYYRSGDYMGITGLEYTYETFLRGKQGVKYKMVNAQGANMGAFKAGQLDTLSIPGGNLTLSIDLPLQQYAERLVQGKVGSVIALEPESGEILVWVSVPSYPPDALAGRDFGVNYHKLAVDSLKPLFNRPIMAAYPPGSIFKIVQGLIALEAGVIGEREKIYCDGSLIGDHAPRGYYDIRRGIMLSSNNFFVKVFRRMINQHPEMSQFQQAPIGLTQWKAQVSRFGFGKPLGVDIPHEAAGFIPGTRFYNKVYGEGRWKFSNLISLSIGQGEILINPIQMANLAAIMANQGYYYRPHLVKAIENRQIPLRYKEKIETGVNPAYFPAIIAGMADALRGTAPKAFIKDIAICGKTGTVQNPHGEDHSVFIAFAPRENPKIALSVVVENAGWGGRAAASIASLLIESYLKGKIDRPWLESYVLAGDFSDKKKPKPQPTLKDSANAPQPSFQDSTSQKNP